MIAFKDPAIRWRFNTLDFYQALEYFKAKYQYRGNVEILGHPKTTFDEEELLTIFRVIRDEAPTTKPLPLSDFSYEPLFVSKTKPTITKLVKDQLYDLFS